MFFIPCSLFFDFFLSLMSEGPQPFPHVDHKKCTQTPCFYTWHQLVHSICSSLFFCYTLLFRVFLDGCFRAATVQNRQAFGALNKDTGIPKRFVSSVTRRSLVFGCFQVLQVAFSDTQISTYFRREFCLFTNRANLMW